MVFLQPKVIQTIDEYVDYLTKENLTSETRAKEKKNQMIKALQTQLGGIFRHRVSPYQSFGGDKGLLLYVYKDPKSTAQWGFSYWLFPDGNVIVYEMKNMKLVKE
jgi:hypothetical protein